MTQDHGPSPDTVTVDESAAVDNIAVDPASGEVVALSAPTLELVDHAERVRELTAELARFRQVLVDEVARRLDASNTRSDVVGEWAVETNAPTSTDYLLDVLRAELEELVEDEVLDRAVLDRVIVTPDPKPPEPRVDKREVNKLKGHTDRRVAGAIAKASQRVNNTRTLKTKRLEKDSA